MQFLYPSFLWALLAIAIPIIIHLFYFRRFKKIYFTNVKYLQEIKEETSSRNKIKNLLILLSRILAVAALVFAFAQPFIPQGDTVKTGNNAVSVFVDNSFSMQATQDEVPLIDIAKEKARQIVNAYTEEDRFQVLTHAFEGRHQRLVSKEDALSLIGEIEISPEVRKLSKVVNRQKQAVGNQEENEILYLISDFQVSIYDLEDYRDTTAELNLLPLQAIQEKNVSLDSVWLESPVPIINQTNKLIVKITNHSDDAAEGVRLSMLKDGQEKPEGTFNIPARTSQVDTINLSLLKTGWHTAELRITDYPIQFDDKVYIALNVQEDIKVLAINDGQPNKYLTALYKGLNNYTLTNQNQSAVDYAQIKEYDLVILNDLRDISTGLASELDNYVVNGGNALIFPSAAASQSSYNNLLNAIGANTLQGLEKEKRTVSSINRDEFIFSEVYEYVGRNITLPTTNANWKLTNYQSRAQESLLRYRDGTPYLVKYVRGEGHLYLCASGLDSELNNLSQNAEIFVPMLYKMAIASTKSASISYTIGSDEIIEAENRISNGDLVYKITGKEEFIPGQIALGNKMLLDVNNQVSKAGFYKLRLDNKDEADLAFNYDRTESDLSIVSTNDLDTGSSSSFFNVLDGSLDSDFSSYISEKDRGIILWKWCLILALLFLAIEIFLLRIWSEK